MIPEIFGRCFDLILRVCILYLLPFSELLIVGREKCVPNTHCNLWIVEVCLIDPKRYSLQYVVLELVVLLSTLIALSIVITVSFWF